MNPERVTALALFEWAVVRQSDLGPGLRQAAEAFGLTPGEVRALVSEWDDPRGHMELQRIRLTLSGAPGYRIEAYYRA